MRKKWLIIASISLAACMSSCSKTCLEEGTCECISRYDCESGQLCINKVCVDEDKNLWIMPNRQFGEACIGNGECVDGYCLPLGPHNGGVCTRVCDEEENACGKGWTCKTWTHAKPEKAEANVKVCVQEVGDHLCMDCTIDGHCNATGDLCVTVGENQFCARDCQDGECPKGYSCEKVSRGDAEYMQCIPNGGSCECGAATDGMSVSCVRENSYGSCSGWAYCSGESGHFAMSACSAQEPSAEVCDGIDNDCDGLIDNLDPSLMPDESMAAEDFPLCHMGGCTGKWQCRAIDEGAAWVCDAGDPEREICNGQDDNCDGRVDETFTDEAGHYVDAANCGACGADCSTMVAHLKRDEDGNVVEGAVSCAWREDEEASRCVPLKCEDGFYPYPHEAPVTCIKLESPACQACSSNADCRVYSDKCTQLMNDYGSFCLQSCSPDSPYPGCTGKVGTQDCCPDGYSCDVVNGELACMPAGNTCTCDASKLGMERNCVVPTENDICQGRQKCEQLSDISYSWSSCDAASLNEEVCDGQDNDCDGEIDEEFRDEKGRYNHAMHCGACYEDCDSRWKAEEMHATGACLLDGEDYACKFTGCKKEAMVLGARCVSDAQCPSSQKCDYQTYYCVAREGELTPTACTEDSGCEKLGREHKCIDGVCKVEVQFHNVNGIDADGCECGEVLNSEIDLPDFFDHYPDSEAHYADRNCDGIDGVIETSLFVNAASTNSQGTREAPFKTIGEAIKAYQPGKHTAILVAVGTYREQVLVTSGIQLYGGYSPDFGTRNIVLYPTQIEAPYSPEQKHKGSVAVLSSNALTVINGFTIRGYDVPESASTGSNGISSYAIVVEVATTRLMIMNNEIIGGVAGSGGRGQAGNSGNSGGNGSNGNDSYECKTATCAGIRSSGGAGGANASCQSARGNSGRAAIGGSSLGEGAYGKDGSSGASNSYGHSYEDQIAYCKYDCLAGGYANGGNGMNGNDGNVGTGGVGCAVPNGRVVGGYWTALTGGSGSAGTDASGGGGGGGGGGAVNNNSGSGCRYGNPYGDVGGSGGGGGAGGCGGAGGGPGFGGGGSFAIWIVQEGSAPRIYGNNIRLGKGGTGGDGGAGGSGGLGGKGGVGGKTTPTAWCGGDGGSGGVGGVGGSGGGGGGGCGGVSYGIAGNALSSVSTLRSSNSFYYPNGVPADAAGAGGKGGMSPASSVATGKDGNSGAVTDVKSF